MHLDDAPDNAFRERMTLVQVDPHISPVPRLSLFTLLPETIEREGSTSLLDGTKGMADGVVCMGDWARQEV